MQPIKNRRNDCSNHIKNRLSSAIIILGVTSAALVYSASASAIAPPVLAARLGSRRNKSSSSSAIVSAAAATATETETTVSAASSTAVIPPTGDTSTSSPETSTTTTNEPSQSSNPIVQLATYVKTSITSFKDGLFQMNSDHKRCNAIRTKQRTFAKTTLGTSRPRGLKGIQTGGISYEEYDFLRKGLVDRNKLFAVVMVSVCLPNYFVYYLWSFPDMMPSPFLKGKDPNEISRERCHAVISTMLDIEKGARVAPWSAKLNPFGRKATERAMSRLGDLVTMGCQSMEDVGATGPKGGRLILEKLKPQLFSAVPLTKQQRLLVGNTIPKQILKGLSKAIGADPLNKGSSPFGIGAVKHIESVTLADEFLVDQSIDVESIASELLSEACSARLIGGPGWTDDERREALVSWLKEVEIGPREMIKQKKEEDDSNGKADGGDGSNSMHYNGILARAALMCYNAVDGTRDSRADSSLLRAMYRGQVMSVE